MKAHTQLPSIESIVKKRLAAGISSAAEFDLYMKGDLVDEDYDDDYKRTLLDELRRSEYETVVPAEFTLVFSPGLPIKVAKSIGSQLRKLVKSTGYPATVIDPYVRKRSTGRSWLGVTPRR